MTKTLTLFVLSHTIALAVFSQKNELSILNNRFYITVPDSAKNIAMQGDIMGPASNENKQTRIIYDEGDKRVVFFASEMNLKTVKDLAKTLKAENETTKSFTTQPAYNNSGVKTTILTPVKFDTTKNAIVIKTMIVENADSTISRIDAYINQAAFAYRGRFEKMADDAFLSFRPGERKVNYAARVDSVKISGTSSSLYVDLPANYLLTMDEGEDFQVFRINKLVPYGSREDKSMLVYFGFYPSTLAHEYGIDDSKLPDTYGDFMFHSLAWNNYTKPGVFYLREQVFDDDEIAKGMKIHVALTSNTVQGIAELAGIVKKLLIVYGNIK